MVTMQSSYLILGGAGFLGSHVVTELLSRGYSPETIVVFDLDIVAEPDRIVGIRYFNGDITIEKQLLEVFSKARFNQLSPWNNQLTHDSRHLHR